MIQNAEWFDKQHHLPMPSSTKRAAVLPPQFTGKAFLLEVREHLVYIPSPTDYPYLYCKLRQHVPKSHIVKQFQTPDHGQGVSFISHAAQSSAFITDISQCFPQHGFLCVLILVVFQQPSGRTLLFYGISGNRRIHKVF